MKREKRILRIINWIQRLKSSSTFRGKWQISLHIFSISKLILRMYQVWRLMVMCIVSIGIDALLLLLLLSWLFQSIIIIYLFRLTLRKGLSSLGNASVEFPKNGWWCGKLSHDGVIYQWFFPLQWCHMSVVPQITDNSSACSTARSGIKSIQHRPL